MLSRAFAKGLRAPSSRAQSIRSTPALQSSRLFASNRGPKKPLDFSKNFKVPPAKSVSEAKVGGAAASSARPQRPSDNATKPPSEDPAASSAADAEPTESPFSQQPLPDLTKGIPSTLEFETAGATSTSRASPSGLNLTEDPSFEGGEEKRQRGELPASAYVSSSEKRRLKIANYMYLASALGCVVVAAYFGRDWEDEEEEQKHANAPSGFSPTLWWARVKARLGDQVNYYQEPAFEKLLPDVDPMFERPYTLVISLEDMLVHSEWTREHGWRLAKRPGVDYFLRYLSQYYELVVFTSVPFAVAEPIIGKLDPYRIITWPLFREATKYENGEYVKDLSYLNRDLSKVIILDTNASHTKNQPENAIILPPWKGDAKDKELVSLIPFLEYIHTMAYTDVRQVLKSFDGAHIPTEFARREAQARKRFLEEQTKAKRRAGSGVGVLGSLLGIKPQPAYEGEQSLSDAVSQGKMLQDIARERGQRAYEALEREIRENGEKWLKEEAANQEKMKEEGMKMMKDNLTGYFGAPTSSK